MDGGRLVFLVFHEPTETWRFRCLKPEEALKLMESGFEVSGPHSTVADIVKATVWDAAWGFGRKLMEGADETDT